jgi:hypothetical protein
MCFEYFLVVIYFEKETIISTVEEFIVLLVCMKDGKTDCSDY